MISRLLHVDHLAPTGDEPLAFGNATLGCFEVITEVIEISGPTPALARRDRKPDATQGATVRSTAIKRAKYFLDAWTNISVPIAEPGSSAMRVSLASCHDHQDFA